MAKWLRSYRTSKASERHGQLFTFRRAFREHSSPWSFGYAPELIDRIVVERKTAQQRAWEAKELLVMRSGACFLLKTTA